MLSMTGLPLADEPTVSDIKLYVILSLARQSLPRYVWCDGTSVRMMH